ncbi:MAG: MBL fold metallo-hydrolase, partial [Lachnoanaerobaculum sp.]
MAEICRINCGTVNCYIVSDKSNAILVDTGSKENINDVIAECDKYNMKLIILTHVHFDHAENASALSEKYNIPVAIHPLDEELFDSYDKQPLHSYGLIGKIVLALSIKKLQNIKVEKAKNLIFVKDKDELS